LPKHDEHRHSQLLDSLADGLRADLWSYIGLESPLEDIEPWIWERLDVQRREGDRLKIYSARRRVEHRGRSVAVRGPVDVYAGIYLEADLTDPHARLWPGTFWASKVQPLALVACAAHDVSMYTGATPAEAEGFLLADTRIPYRPITVRPSMPGGVTIWAPDFFVTVEELGRRFSKARRRYAPFRGRLRARQFEPELDDLIRFVEERRPHKGKHRDNMRWRDVLAEWNATYPDRAYAGLSLERPRTDGIESAYHGAVKRRAKREGGGGS